MNEPLPRPDFAAHRATLLEHLEADEAVLVFGGAVQVRNADAEHRYRPHSDVWWLSGWPEPEVAIFIKPGEEPVHFFVQPKDPERETWTGRRVGPDAAVTAYGADRGYTIDELGQELVRLLQGVRALHYEFGVDFARDQMLKQAIYKAGRAARRNGLVVPETFHAPSKLLHELRLHKNERELEVMRAAAHISAEAHKAAMRAGSPGTWEFELESLIETTFRKSGGTGAGYTSIVAAGDNANILHYITNDQQLVDGDLVLIDAGGEVDYYTADITRTWPANGRFSEPQRKVYQAVLDAQLASIEATKPGSTFMDVHDAAILSLTTSMVALGLLSGDVDELIDSGAFKRYYMHGTSHWLGLDVHDVGTYVAEGQSRALAPGMVLTIEPGLYIPADDTDAPEALRGIGVRIEDDILVTAEGREVLTAGVPKTIEAIEALCARGVA